MGSWAVVEKGGRRYVGGWERRGEENARCLPLSSTLNPSATIPARAKLGYPGMYKGLFMPSVAIPPGMTLKLMVMTPAISMAPQKEISPSP